MSKLPSYMRPEQPQGEAPPFQLNEQVEVKVVSIEETTGKYGKQLQIDGTMPAKSNWRARAWIKYYPQPAPNQYLGKLCLAIQRVTGQEFGSLDSAVNALKSYGRVYMKVSGFREYQEKQYPKFSVVAEILPGEQPQQKLPDKPVLPAGPKLPLKETRTPHERMIDFIKRHPDLIGRDLPDVVWNQELALDSELVNELIKEKMAYTSPQTDMPHLDEKAKNYL